MAPGGGSVTAPAAIRAGTTNAAERDLIMRALDDHQGHVTNTARALGLERSHLYKKMKALGIQRDGQHGG
ncbi:MAG: helix-turn-helix domain-containing protein [Polyangiales bacterium]